MLHKIAIHCTAFPMQALPAKVTCSIPIAILFRRRVASLHYTLNYVQNIVPYGDFMDIPALFRSGISHKREILHKSICFVFRKWEPLPPPFTQKCPMMHFCIIRHFLSFLMHKGRDTSNVQKSLHIIHLYFFWHPKCQCF